MPSQDCLHQNTIQLYGLDQEPIDIVEKFPTSGHEYESNSPPLPLNGYKPYTSSPAGLGFIVAISSTTPTTSDIYVGSSHLRPTPWSPHLSSGLLPAMLFSSSYHLLWSCI
ncbi:unnamed protein product [Lactuca saligna]|uniref:Uncharacterized protein n=1 Tax=Lactuca saligna TaxID=75948 RepID=A0AA36EME5_LACSI|nr:unnamed protein product [Lactuca saligna]